MSSTPTWPKITNALGSTTTEFGASDWANLISDYYNGTNLALLDASKPPLIGTLTRYTYEKLALYDADSSHYLSFSVDDIDTGANRKIKFRRMNSPFETDYAVLEGLPQTLINKTIDADLNTITNISSTQIKSSAAIPYSKLNLTGTILNADVNTSAAIVTTKLADSANFVLTTRANTLGDFDHTFKDNRLKINNPADTFAYTIIASAIAANRNLTLPLLTGNDIMVTEAFSQTLTNKTINADSNTITNIEDADIKAAAGIVTTKLADSTNFVLTTRANSFGDFDNTFKDNRLKINNPADTFAYTIIGAAIAANRNLTLPLLTGDDVVVTEAFAQALSNKSIDADANTITNIENADIKAAAGIVTSKLADSSNFILKTLDNTFGAHFQDFTKMTAPGNPGANDIRLYVDTTDTHLKIRNNAGTIVDLHTGGGGATNLDALTDVDLTTVTPNNGDVLTYTTTGTKWVPAAAPGAGGGITASSVDTLTNKSISGSTNTLTNIGDSAISSHTSTKITITAKGQLNSQIVYNDQANVYGDFLQTFRNSRIKLMNPANTFGYIFTGAAIVADRTINIPLMTGTDEILLKDFAATITNKSIDADTNIITNIENADIKAAAGIVTTKLADSTNFVLTTRTNSFGDFDQVFKDNRLLINNPADTFAYTIIGSAIAANRSITLPLLTGNDVAVTEAFAQTLTNKTIAAGSNTISGIVDANITAHTTTKITTTSKSLLNTSIVYGDQTNTFGDFDQILRDNRLRINNPADTFSYTIIAAAIAANRSITLPLLTTDDTMVTQAFAQTLTNKTIDADSNTITNIENADIKAAAGIVYSKLNLATSILNADINASAAIATSKLADSANFLLSTLDNNFGAHFHDITRMTAPANPNVNDARFYTKQIDANNDGFFVKIKKAGSFVEVQIA